MPGHDYLPYGRAKVGTEPFVDAAQHDSAAVLYLIPGRGVRLPAVLGNPPVPETIVVIERTTVAAGLRSGFE